MREQGAVSSSMKGRWNGFRGDDEILNGMGEKGRDKIGGFQPTRQGFEPMRHYPAASIPPNSTSFTSKSAKI
jgi:hypothetical protein